LSTVQELTGDFKNGLAITNNSTLDFDHLAGLSVEDSIDLSISINNIALLEKFSTINDAETVGKMDQLQKITINDLGEDSLDDGLPTDNDSEIHGGGQDLTTVNIDFSLVTNSLAEFLDETSIDSFASADKLLMDRDAQEIVIGVQAEPKLVVEVLDAIIATLLK
jgi:hypothetical protein